jgi:hypothetical protein
LKKTRRCRVERDILKKEIGIFSKRSNIYTFIRTHEKLFPQKEVQNIGSYSKLLSMESHSISKKQRVELVKQKIDSIYHDSKAIPKPKNDIAVGLAFSDYITRRVTDAKNI